MAHFKETPTNRLQLKEKMRTTHPSYATVFCVLAIGTWFFLLSISSTMAEKTSPSESPGVYIIYTEKPDGEAEAHHLQTLSTVIGSEGAAKEALVYTYTTAATGFSAKLTAEQAEEMSKQAGVLQVVPSRTLQLHSGAKAATMYNF